MSVICSCRVLEQMLLDRATMGLSHMAQRHVIKRSRGQVLHILALVSQPCVCFCHSLGLLEE